MCVFCVCQMHGCGWGVYASVNGVWAGNASEGIIGLCMQARRPVHEYFCVCLCVNLSVCECASGCTVVFVKGPLQLKWKCMQWPTPKWVPFYPTGHILWGEGANKPVRVCVRARKCVFVCARMCESVCETESERQRRPPALYSPRY